MEKESRVAVSLVTREMSRFLVSLSAPALYSIAYIQLELTTTDSPHSVPQSSAAIGAVYPSKFFNLSSPSWSPHRIVPRRSCHVSYGRPCMLLRGAPFETTLDTIVFVLIVTWRVPLTFPTFLPLLTLQSVCFPSVTHTFALHIHNPRNIVGSRC